MLHASIPVSLARVDDRYSSRMPTWYVSTFCNKILDLSMKLIQYSPISALALSQTASISFGYFHPFPNLHTQKQGWFCFQSTLFSNIPGCKYFQFRGIHVLEQCLIGCEWKHLAIASYIVIFICNFFLSNPGQLTLPDQWRLID